MNSKTAMLDVDGDANITGNLTVGTINLGSIATGNVRVFEDSSNASFYAGTMTHNYGLVFAICSVASVPTNARKLMTMDVETGVAINTSLSITDNLGVGGGVMTIGNRILWANGVNGGLTTESTVYANALVSTAPNVYFGTLATSAVYAADQILQFKGGLDPKGLYSQTLYTFTAPYACYVKVEVNCTIHSGSAAALQVMMYINKSLVNSILIFQLSNGSSISGAGQAIISCVAGTTLELRNLIANCKIFVGQVIYTIL